MNKQKRLSHIAAWQQSRETKKVYCDNAGISYVSFTRWLRQDTIQSTALLLSTDKSKKKKVSHPSCKTSKSEAKKPGAFVPLSSCTSTCLPMSTTKALIQLPNGVNIQIAQSALDFSFLQLLTHV